MDLINEIKFLISIVLVVKSNSDSENFLFMNVLISILDLILSSLINLFLFFKFAPTVFNTSLNLKGSKMMLILSKSSSNWLSIFLTSLDIWSLKTSVLIPMVLK